MARRLLPGGGGGGKGGGDYSDGPNAKRARTSSGDPLKEQLAAAVKLYQRGGEPFWGRVTFAKYMIRASNPKLNYGENE